MFTSNVGIENLHLNFISLLISNVYEMCSPGKLGVYKGFHAKSLAIFFERNSK